MVISVIETTLIVIGGCLLFFCGAISFLIVQIHQECKNRKLKSKGNVCPYVWNRNANEDSESDGMVSVINTPERESRILEKLIESAKEKGVN